MTDKPEMQSLKIQDDNKTLRLIPWPYCPFPSTWREADLILEERDRMIGFTTEWKFLFRSDTLESMIGYLATPDAFSITDESAGCVTTTTLSLSPDTLTLTPEGGWLGEKAGPPNSFPMNASRRQVISDWLTVFARKNRIKLINEQADQEMRERIKTEKQKQDDADRVAKEMMQAEELHKEAEGLL